MQWRDELSRWALLGGLMSLAVSANGAPLRAQVTYRVFPVNPPDATVAAIQPTGHATASRVTLGVRDSTVEYVVNTLARQAHLRLLYNNSDPAFAKRITVRVTDAGIADAFAMALKGTGLIAKVTSDGETVVIRAASATDRANVAGGIVVGRVTDSASGAGLGGAAVRVDGTKLSAVTSDSGNFTLKDVPTGEQVLSVKLFGYKPAARTVTVVDGERTPVVRIALVAVPTVLSGVVTTATGQQKRIEVGNDITSLNVDSIMRAAPITSVTDLLETRVPGLTVQHSSGEPGNPSRIRLRGVSSISGNNDPIIIIDGIRVYGNQSDPRNANLAKSVNGGGDASQNGHGYAAPSPLDQINPNDVETIEVSKGPSASALYGSDAANGVIVITTKHGHAGPTHWTLSLGQGVNWLPGAWPMNYYKFGKDSSYENSFGLLGTPSLLKEHVCDWFDSGCVVDSLVPYQALNDPRYSVFSHGNDQQASLTVSGGVPTLTYNLTGSGTGTLGNLKLPTIERDRYQRLYGPIPSYLVRPDNYKTWSVGGVLTANPTPHAHVTLNSTLFNSNQQQGSLQTAVLQLEGEFLNPPQPGDPPLIANDVEKATDAQTNSTNILTLAWQVAPRFPLNATVGMNTNQRTDQSYIPYGISYGGIGGAIVGGDTTGSYGVGHGTSHNQTLTVGTEIPALRQHVTIALGGNIYSQSTSDIQTYTNALAPGVSVPASFLSCSVTCTNSPTFQAITNQSTFGWYFEPRLNVASRFFMAPGFRLDGGSGGTHATVDRGGVSTGTSGLSAFPKIDFSYVAIEPSHPYGPVTELRPRLAFGLAGTQPNPAARLRLFGDSAEAVGLSGATPVVRLNGIGNTQLSPETSRELEGGFDLVLWQGRLGVTWTSYNKTRYNAIINLPVAPSVLGANYSRDVNIGEVRNTGTELTLNVTPLQRRAFSWDMYANMSNNNNLVIKLAKGFDPNEQLGIVAGYPLFSHWARPIVGYSDLNHNGIIEYNEFQVSDSNIYAGQADPKYQFNFGTGVTLLNGRLSLNAGFAFTNGMTQFNNAALASNAFNFIVNAPGSTLATQAAVEAVSCRYNQGNYTGNSVTVCPPITEIGFIQTVNEFRFNDLSVNYRLPATLTSWFHVPRATVALQGSNLGLHTNYRGLDPNVNAFSTVSSGDETVDLGQIPEPRTWWLKLTLEN